ncbi:MAG: HDOD domain-containing protein [Steroidobacterales bacterium]
MAVTKMALRTLNAEPAELKERLRAALDADQVELPPLPQVASEVVASGTADPRNAAAFSQLIQRDPALAANVMRIANSAAYRPRVPIVSLQQAIAWLGIGEIRNIALAVCVRGQLFVAPGHEPEIQELWRESVATACWARELARLKKRNVESAYLCGLLHRIGRAAAIGTLSRIEVAGRHTVAARTFSALADEFEVDFGRKLAAQWQLPAAVSEAIHGWRNAGRTTGVTPEVLQTYVGHLLAIDLLHPELGNLSPLTDHGALAELDVYPDELEALRGRRDSVLASIAQF